MIGLFATRGSRQLSKLRGNWNQMQLGGTCKNGFITQADFLAAGNSSLRFGGFLKWRYPCSSSILIGFSDFSIINKAFWSSNWGFSISGNSHLGSAVLISNDRSKEPKALRKWAFISAWDSVTKLPAVKWQCPTQLGEIKSSLLNQFIASLQRFQFEGFSWIFNRFPKEATKSLQHMCM